VSPSLPALTILRLPNDHTEGTAPGFPTPQAFAAQNDAAVGQVVDLVSHSPLWGSTAIFVTEDDAQNGADHVDAHRTESLVISPYTSHDNRFVDHTLYDTAAMIRTMELIVGLQPLSQFDANATPMWRSFTSTPDTSTYSTISSTVALTQANTLSSYCSPPACLFDSGDRQNLAPINMRLPYPYDRITLVAD